MHEHKRNGEEHEILGFDVTWSYVHLFHSLHGFDPGFSPSLTHALCYGENLQTTRGE